MKVLIALLLLLVLLALANAIPRKREGGLPHPFAVSYEAITNGKLPDFSAYTQQAALKGMRSAWLSPGKVNDAFGKKFAEKVNASTFSNWYLVYKGESKTIPGGLEWELSLWQSESGVRTIVLSPEGKWIQL